MPEEPSRRSFLSGAGAAALTGLTAAACSSTEASEIARPTATPAEAGAVETTVAEAVAATITEDSDNTDNTGDDNTGDVVPASAVQFSGSHQAGLLLPTQPAGIIAAFDARATSRDELHATFVELSAEVERLMSGRAAEEVDDIRPPVESGVLGANPGSTGVAITLMVGASLFDDRFGLAQHRPAELFEMPRFFNDRQIDPALTHGDLAVQITAPTQQAVVRALHQLVLVSINSLTLRWVQEGYNDVLPPSDDRKADKRNLMGFLDGTSNLDTADPDVMAEHVWVEAGDEPSWAVGGTYVAVRIIRILVEFWATAALVRQEQIFGRHRESGAPLGQQTETEEPAFERDQSDVGVPLASHIRRANPRTPGSARILRQGFSYLNGVDAEGTLDQGLLFVAMQKSLRRGFVEVQARLDGEPLEDYVRPVGGGFFFALPGVDDGGWLGQQLFEA